MSNDIDIKLLGAREIDKILNELPQKVRRKFILAAWRRSAKPLIQAARNNIRNYSKQIAESIGNITGKSKTFPTIYIGPRAKGKFKNIAWIAPFIEFGVLGRKRNRKQGYQRETDNPEFAWVGKLKPGAQYRKDQPAHPFMRPAVDSTINQVQNNFEGELKTVFKKTIDKYNKRSAL